MPQPIQVVDAFTDVPFAGNPAAVCVLEGPAEAGWMQKVAGEMNLSETAFVVPDADGGAYALRWFTPALEMDLCGHATLAAAHVLWEQGALGGSEPARFDTLSGRLTATREGDGWIALDFPAEPAKPAEPPAALAGALGVPLAWSGRNRMDWLVELADEAAVRGLAPDFTRLAEVETRGVIVTARAEAAGGDFVSRFFGPRAGVAEDPVTGSAHCALAPYWAAKLGRERLTGVQLSRRGGVVRVQVRGPRVSIAGRAVTVWRGELVAC